MTPPVSRLLALLMTTVAASCEDAERPTSAPSATAGPPASGASGASGGPAGSLGSGGSGAGGETGGASSGTGGAAMGGTGGAAMGGTGGAAMGGTGGAAMGGTGGAAMGGTGGGNPLGGAPLAPLPRDQVGECVPPAGSGGGWGACCKFLTCFTPEAGPCPVPGPTTPDPIHTATECRGKGSGTCNCGAILGPFAPDDGPGNCGSTQGACCYIVPIAGCLGRPLAVGGGARVAPLARVRGWT